MEIMNNNDVKSYSIMLKVVSDEDSWWQEGMELSVPTHKRDLMGCASEIILEHGLEYAGSNIIKLIS